MGEEKYKVLDVSHSCVMVTNKVNQAFLRITDIWKRLPDMTDGKNYKEVASILFPSVAL